jgi:hypothetical protein
MLPFIKKISITNDLKLLAEIGTILLNNSPSKNFLEHSSAEHSLEVCHHQTTYWTTVIMSSATNLK